jgi:hypothetical protein
MDRLRFYTDNLSVRHGTVCSVANRLLKNYRNSQTMARLRQGTRRARKLAPAQERQIFRWVNGNNPMQREPTGQICAGTDYPLCFRFSSSCFCSSLSFFLSCGLLAAAKQRIGSTMEMLFS